DYYTRLERGNVNGVSESVLEGLAGAPQLDEAERAHLFDLARAQRTTPSTRRRPAKHRVRPSVQRILDSMTAAPAFARDGPHDTGSKQLHHPVVGDLSLTYERMELIADPGLTLFAYTAEPGSRSEEALNLLASWTATLDQDEPAHVTE